MIFYFSIKVKNLKAYRSKYFELFINHIEKN